MSKLIIVRREETLMESDRSSYGRNGNYYQRVPPMYYDIYAGKIATKYLVKSYTSEILALTYANDIALILKIPVETNWEREYRVTTTVKAKSAEAALDRISGDDLEIRRAATVVSV